MYRKTLRELSQGLQSKEFSSLELTESFLKRIKKDDKRLNTFITVTEELAKEQAKEADKKIAAKKAGPLTGIPLAQKDIFCTQGVKTSCGSKMLDNFNVDTIVHLAAYVSIPESMESSFEYFQNNEMGTFNLLQNIFKTKKKPHFIYASSPEVYGNPLITPIAIDHPLYPRSVYAATKVAAEKHCYALFQWYNYPITIFRNFNTYGENQNSFTEYSAVIPIFITRALKNQPIIVHNDGNQTRDFMYVKDAVRAYLLAILNREKAIGETFNIGTGKQTSIIDLAKKIKELTNSASEIKFESGRWADLQSLEADVSKTKEKLNWEPEFSLEEGLKRIIEWYKKFVM